MPNKKASDGNAGKSSGQSCNTYVPNSGYQCYQEAGGFNRFMHSYGLKPWSHEDIQENATNS
ncbi:hypothetical protein GY45DRAFT_1327916 [Cubamyces sp. BRFM 1775]|nr:hypothetical protein GY45DRAFT_1327916 [Cubamyces sp. BRFM 1775]